jgi:hypothetical protein
MLLKIDLLIAVTLVNFKKPVGNNSHGLLEV